MNNLQYIGFKIKKKKKIVSDFEKQKAKDGAGNARRDLSTNINSIRMQAIFWTQGDN